jgi:hypothetical protein
MCAERVDIGKDFLSKTHLCILHEENILVLFPPIEHDLQEGLHLLIIDRVLERKVHQHHESHRHIIIFSRCFTYKGQIIEWLALVVQNT